MRISDWSSDVCSSDLGEGRDGRIGGDAGEEIFARRDDLVGVAAKSETITEHHPHDHRECGDGEDLGQHRCHVLGADEAAVKQRSEEHTSELQSLMRISYAVFCLKKKNISNPYRL